MNVRILNDFNFKLSRMKRLRNSLKTSFMLSLAIDLSWWLRMIGRAAKKADAKVRRNIDEHCLRAYL